MLLIMENGAGTWLEALPLLLAFLVLGGTFHAIVEKIITITRLQTLVPTAVTHLQDNTGATVAQVVGE